MQGLRTGVPRVARVALAAIATLIACMAMLGGFAPDRAAAQAADPFDGQRLKIVRTVEWSHPDGEIWEWEVQATALLEDGSISGEGSLNGVVQRPGGYCTEWKIEALNGPPAVVGTYAQDTAISDTIKLGFKIPVKISWTCVEGRPPPPKDDGGWWIGLSDTLDFSDTPLSTYAGTLADGRYKDQRLVGTGTDVSITTEITLIGAGEGELVVTPEHPLIPGHTAHINAIDIDVPELPELADAGPLTLRASIRQAGYGGLADTAAAARAGRGQRTLEIADITPGSTHRVYYSWDGKLIPDFTETVKAQIIGQEVEGSAEFRVGFGVAISEFTRFTKTEAKNRELVPFKLIAKATRQGEAGSLPQLAEKFDLEMILGLERIGFQPINSVEGLLAALSFDLTDWAEALAGQGVSVDDEQVGGKPGSLYGDKLYWRVGEDGRLWDPGEAEPGTKFPNYLPFQRGVHFFKAQVTGINHDIEALDNPDPQPLGHALHVDLKDDAQAFMDDVVLGCVEELLSGVADEVQDLVGGDLSELAKIELGAAGVLWGCLSNALETQFVEDWLAEHSFLNVLVMTVLETEEEVGELMDAAQALVGEAAKRTDARAILLVEGLAETAKAVSSADGQLRAAPSPFLTRPGGGQKSAPSRERAQTRERVLRKSERQAFYVRKGEAIEMTLPSDADTEVVLITPGQSKRLKSQSTAAGQPRIYRVLANNP